MHACVPVTDATYHAAASSVARASGQFGAAFAPIVTGFLLVDYHQADLGMWTKLQPLRVYVLFALFSLVGAFLFYELGLETGGRHLPNSEHDTVCATDGDVTGQRVGRVGRGWTDRPERRVCVCVCVCVCV